MRNIQAWEFYGVAIVCVFACVLFIFIGNSVEKKKAKEDDYFRASVESHHLGNGKIFVLASRNKNSPIKLSLCMFEYKYYSFEDCEIKNDKKICKRKEQFSQGTITYNASADLVVVDSVGYGDLLNEELVKIIDVSKIGEGRHMITVKSGSIYSKSVSLLRFDDKNRIVEEPQKRELMDFDVFASCIRGERVSRKDGYKYE